MNAADCHARAQLRPPRSRRARLLRRVRRTLRARDAGRAGRGADRGLPRRAAGSGVRASCAAAPHYVGRPTPLYEAARLGAAGGGARIFLKREDLPTPARTRSTTRSARRCWPGAWARRASSPRPAPGSTAWRRRPCCALLGLECVVYMGDRGHGAAGAQRLPHAPARRARCVAVEAGSRDAEGRHQRGDARLGRRRAGHALPARLGARAASRIR